MSDPDDQNSIRFYFSFRSPYAWLAAERLDSELGDLGVPIERIPIYPTPELFPNDPSALPNKQAYLIQDIPRLAREQGLKIRFPSSSDTDWALSHGLPLRCETSDPPSEWPKLSGQLRTGGGPPTPVRDTVRCWC